MAAVDDDVQEEESEEKEEDDEESDLDIVPVAPSDIPRWDVAYHIIGARPASVSKTVFLRDDSLNSKVAIWQGDITTLKLGAIVNAANRTLYGGGGIDGAIHKAAGRRLHRHCKTLGGCDTGGAKITPAFRLPAKRIIHAVGPITGGGPKEPRKLSSCYRTSLELLTEHELRSIAFCCIATGIYGYPNREGAQVALATVRNFLEEHEDEDDETSPLQADKIDLVVFCVYTDEDREIYEQEMPRFFPVEEPISDEEARARDAADAAAAEARKAARVAERKAAAKAGTTPAKRATSSAATIEIPDSDDEAAARPATKTKVVGRRAVADAGDDTEEEEAIAVAASARAVGHNAEEEEERDNGSDVDSEGSENYRTLRREEARERRDQDREGSASDGPERKRPRR